jgi:phosphoribosylformylglycinamidine cyclo-ligase
LDVQDVGRVGRGEPDEYDLAGAAVGAVEADALLGPHRVRAGDVVLGMASSGLHSNGFSLVRRVLQVAGWGYERQVPEFGRTLGEELLEPTRVYAADVVELAAALGPALHAVSHVTGGGLAANLARVLPQELEAVVDRGTWTPAPVFDVVARLGAVPRSDLERTLNLGIGMIAVVDPGQADAATALLDDRGIDTWVIGNVGMPRPDLGGDVTQGAKGVDGGAVRLVGDHPARRT